MPAFFVCAITFLHIRKNNYTCMFFVFHPPHPLKYEFIQMFENRKQKYIVQGIFVIDIDIT